MKDAIVIYSGQKARWFFWESNIKKLFLSLLHLFCLVYFTFIFRLFWGQSSWISFIYYKNKSWRLIAGENLYIYFDINRPIYSLWKITIH